jgi:hypothetical protein
VNLLGMKLVHPTNFYKLDDVLDDCRPIKVMSKSFTNQRARRYMVAALASMDLYE